MNKIFKYSLLSLGLTAASLCSSTFGFAAAGEEVSEVLAVRARSEIISEQDAREFATRLTIVTRYDGSISDKYEDRAMHQELFYKIDDGSDVWVATFEVGTARDNSPAYAQSLDDISRRYARERKLKDPTLDMFRVVINNPQIQADIRNLSRFVSIKATEEINKESAPLRAQLSQLMVQLEPLNEEHTQLAREWDQHLKAMRAAIEAREGELAVQYDDLETNSKRREEIEDELNLLLPKISAALQKVRKGRHLVSQEVREKMMADDPTFAEMERQRQTMIDEINSIDKTKQKYHDAINTFSMKMRAEYLDRPEIVEHRERDERCRKKISELSGEISALQARIERINESKPKKTRAELKALGLNFEGGSLLPITAVENWTTELSTKPLEMLLKEYAPLRM